MEYLIIIVEDWSFPELFYILFVDSDSSIAVCSFPLQVQ